MEFDDFILGGDVGGTNTHLGLFGIKKHDVRLLLPFHFRNSETDSLHQAVNAVLGSAESRYGIRIKNACIAVAGALPHSRDSVKVTNSGWIVKKDELMKQTGLKKLLLVNDFEAVGYSVNVLAPKDLMQVKKAKKIPGANSVVIGAGTGLGKSALLYDEGEKSYVPVSSEAGHSDFPAQNRHELEIADFIRKTEKIKNVSYEHLLSGSGLARIYSFVTKVKGCKNSLGSGIKPEAISKHRKHDKACRETFGIFKTIYARFARNCALDSLAYGGVYIAGGIAQKNMDMFDKAFIKEFENNDKLKHVLRRIPVYIITNQDAGLIGAGFAGERNLK